MEREVCGRTAGTGTLDREKYLLSFLQRATESSNLTFCVARVDVSATRSVSRGELSAVGVSSRGGESFEDMG